MTLGSLSDAIFFRIVANSRAMPKWISMRDPGGHALYRATVILAAPLVAAALWLAVAALRFTRYQLSMPALAVVGLTIFLGISIGVRACLAKRHAALIADQNEPIPQTAVAGILTNAVIAFCFICIPLYAAALYYLRPVA